MLAGRPGFIERFDKMNILHAPASSRAPRWLGAFLPLALAGCVGPMAVPDGAATHPANPAAESSPLPPWEPGLLAVTNLVQGTAASGTTPALPHEHESKPARPGTEERK